MKTFLTLGLSLKSLFVALLFTFFVWQFAIPSFRKFLYSGVIADKRWILREPENSPSMTFCALNSETSLGWKSNKTFYEDWYTKSAMVVFCNNQTSVDDAMDCLDKQTYNLTETIKTKNSYGQTVRTDNGLWTQDISETYQGKVFRN